MDKSTIATQRLINQQIESTSFSSVKDMVSWMGAIQAQDYNMSKWAIAARLPISTNNVIEKSLNNAEIIRTHVLRPTWHIVAAADVRWMLQLTAPQIKKAAMPMYKNLELDDSIFTKTNTIIAKALENGNHLTRQELTEQINKAGIETNALRATHIMFQAENDLVVCNGAMRGKNFTYALLDEVVPPSSERFTKEESLAMLANRYFTSHGPATLQDFTWWSGLKISDAKTALELVKNELLSEEIDGQKYWFKAISAAEKVKKESLYLLPAFDEFMVSYKDRSASLPMQNTREIITSNGIFKPIIVLNGKVEGLWKAIPQKNKIQLQLSLFDVSMKLNDKLLNKAIKKYSDFLNTQVELI